MLLALDSLSCGYASMTSSIRPGIQSDPGRIDAPEAGPLMTYGDQALSSARARRREEALDPSDIAARTQPIGPTVVPRRRWRNALGSVRRVLTSTLVFGALVAGASLAWTSGVASRAGDEVAQAVTQVATWTEERAGFGADAAPVLQASETAQPSPVAGIATITGTDGHGVAVRSTCSAGARTGGAFPEGARVRVLEEGSGDCSGWTLVAVDDVESWVLDRYLAPTSADGASAR